MGRSVFFDRGDDGGVWLRSDYNGGSFNGVLLITGGFNGSHDGLYWHIIQNGVAGPILGQAAIAGLQNSDIHLKLVVRGNNYHAYVNDDPAPVTTLVTDLFPSGSVALYDNSEFGPVKQTLDNFKILLLDQDSDGIYPPPMTTAPRLAIRASRTATRTVRGTSVTALRRMER
jgi:hypothetical protein